MKRTYRVLVFMLLAGLVLIGGCVDNGPVSTGGGGQTTETGTSVSTSTDHMDEANTGTTTTTETVTETVTQTNTETGTETVTETPTPNGSVQLDEDGLPICTGGDMGEDSGCEDNKTIEGGSGPGFSLPEDIVLNITLQPILQIVPINLQT